MLELREFESIPSPALLVFPAIVRANLQAAVRIAGSPDRLRPHVKTHKTREIVRLELELGVGKHKCATLAEASLLAQCGATDILLAYPLVGPNVSLFADLIGQFPAARFAAIADDLVAARRLSAEMSRRGLACDLLLDLNVGQNRTGVPIGADAAGLYGEFARLPGLRPGGLHVYDGHHRQESADERSRAVAELLSQVREFRTELGRRHWPTPRLVLGGTPTFPIHARCADDGVECSPGTFVLHDAGYRDRYDDIRDFRPAAAVLTRLVSRPGANRLTFDVGTKAIAADPPLELRCQLVGLEDARIVAHNEEHLVLESDRAGQFQVGDGFLAIPTHVCPTMALYPAALTVEDGRATGRWAIAARDR